MIDKNDKTEDSSHPLESLIEASLMDNRMGHETNASLLEAILERTDQNDPVDMIALSMADARQNTEKIIQAIKDKPEAKEPDFTETNSLLRSLTEEVKKKDEEEVTYSIDAETRELLKGDKGDTTVVEKVIEKTEVIREIPIVTNEIKEVAVHETGLETVTKINELPTDDEKFKIDAKHIKNLPKGNSLSDGNYLMGGLHKVYTDETLTGDGTPGDPLHAIGGGSGTPAAPNKSVQYNKDGEFGGNANFRYNEDVNQLAIGPEGEREGADNIPVTVVGEANTYIGAQIQNTSTGDNASADFFVAADNDSPTETGHFADLGIWGSGFVPSNTGIIEVISISNDGAFDGGTGYIVGDVLTIQTGNADATIEVTSVSGSGEVLTADITLNGTGYEVGINNPTVGGTGSGCYVDILNIFDLSGFEANDGYCYISGGNMVVGTDTPGKNFKIFLGGFAAGNKAIEVSQSQGTSGVIPQLDADPGDPFEESAWVLKSGGGSIPDGTPIGMLLGLTYTDVTPINTYQLSYKTKEGTIIRTTLS